jgi:hypothetical protein
MISKITNNYKNIVELFGPCRLEFDIIEDGNYYTECIPFIIKMAPKTSHEVFRVKNLQDIEKLQENNYVIYIDPQIIRERKMDLITSLAFKLSQKTIILYPGSTTTAHSAIILREVGHKVIYVGQREFQTGEKIDLELLMKLGKNGFLTLHEDGTVKKSYIYSLDNRKDRPSSFEKAKNTYRVDIDKIDDRYRATLHIPPADIKFSIDVPIGYEENPALPGKEIEVHYISELDNTLFNILKLVNIDKMELMNVLRALHEMGKIKLYSENENVLPTNADSWIGISGKDLP